MASVFVTGFPGFLGSKLVERLLERYPARVTIDCLVQPAYRHLAESRAAEIDRELPGACRRIRLRNGDITRPHLGLDLATYTDLADQVVEIYHLAAVYDLGVSRELAMAVNVQGTQALLAFTARAGRHLRRFQYVSTCYVSGSYPGIFAESDLVKGQAFNNYYEETKYLAEVEVQREMANGLPVTIYRPAIVVGDSQTGATQKYDGFYYILQWLLRQPAVALMPVVGDSSRYEVNFVPRDFVVDALAYLSSQESSAGTVYQLCDPDPLLVNEVMELVAEVTERRIIRLPLTRTIAKAGLKYVPGIGQFMRIEPETINYFTLPTRYTCTNTLADLAGTGIACPPLPSYIYNLVKYMEQHPEVPARAMV